MCGIFAYTGKRNCQKTVIEGLQSLEYRGYDSWGIALKSGRKIVIRKEVGKVSAIENNAGPEAGICIGHTRWATHGEVSVSNSHPHYDSARNVFVVHNGIIENYDELKEHLNGESFYSRTDTEIIPKLIARYTQAADFKSAILRVSRLLKGNFAFLAISKESDVIAAVRNGSPLVAGGEPGDFFIASDIQSFARYSDQVYFLQDGECLFLDTQTAKIEFVRYETGEPITKSCQQVQTGSFDAELGSYKHFMAKEIYEQPEKLRLTISSYVHPRGDLFADQFPADFLDATRIVIIACGTSWHAGLVAEYWLEMFAGIPVEVEYASEFRYRQPVVDAGTLVIAISQSGETADTIAGIKEARRRGARVISICNVIGSTITRISDISLYTQAGPEIGVASTKAFTTQLAVLFLFAVHFAFRRGRITVPERDRFIFQLREIPVKLERFMSDVNPIVEVMEEYYSVSNALFLGRGVNYPIALEGALKLKEISYIHAEGYPAAEMKHGPIALIDENMPTVFICVRDQSYEKVLSNIQEVKARKGLVIAIATEKDSEIAKLADQVIYIPETLQELSPFLTVVPMQLLAYHIANRRGCDIDKPRNLAKSVTVE